MKTFSVSICDSNVSAVVLGGNAGLFLFTYTDEISRIAEHNAFILVSGSETKSTYRSPRLPGAFTDPPVIKSTLLENTLPKNFVLTPLNFDT